MKLIFRIILLIMLLVINIMPASAITWLHYGANRYIDMDSIKKQSNYIYYTHKIYNDGRFEHNVYYSIEYCCVDTDKRLFKIIRIIDFDRQNRIIDDYAGSNTFRNIIPKSFSDNALYIVQGYANGTITRADFKSIEDFLNAKVSK